MEVGRKKRPIKLLGTPFWCTVGVGGRWPIFENTIKNELKYWSSTNLLLVKQTPIVNQVLMSSLWHFNAIWARSKRFLMRIKALLCNYLCFGSENMARAWVSWDCTLPKNVGGLNLISPDDAMKALMSQWIIQDLIPGKLNLRIFVRYLYEVATFLPRSTGSFYGVLPPCDCSPYISSPRVGPKFGTTLPNRGSDGKYNYTPLSINSRGYFASQYVEYAKVISSFEEIHHNFWFNY